ncbi:hypothetical protein C1646_777509 [Rhizophagus diaphanus]|nr:hypothetical protein C1646_777509 [Rhizophagus diaphanus] [Rhizophagus sp. MUCL 43196]
MDPDDVPEELKNLTKIKEMLIAQTFPIISVYYLHGSQYAYSGNVINFPQDIGEFVSRLSQHPSTLDTGFYRSVDVLLPQVRDAENRLHHVDYKPRDANCLDKLYSSPFPLCSENHVIDDALARMQSETGPDTAINEFNMPGYIARTFPTLYLTGSADL